MKKLFVFTNQDSLSAINAEFGGRKDIKILSKTKNTLLFNEKTKEFKVCSNYTESGLYFIFDEIAALPTVDFTDLYILKHRKPKFTISNIPTSNLKEGVHESGNKGKYYPELISILKDQEGEKVERIFKTIFKTDSKLRAKIKLIQVILSGGRPESIDKEIDNGSQILKAIQNLPKGDNVFSKEFQTAFQAFQQTLDI